MKLARAVDCCGAGEGNRTLVLSLGSFRSTIELHPRARIDLTESIESFEVIALIINGQPRMPHSGIDYSADRGTPVVASNRGRVALLAEFFFAGRFVVLDHGLGLYTLYFHLDGVAVTEGQMVERGQTVGTVGTTGRSTGPHLHFGAQLGRARVNPPDLYALAVRD